MSSIIPQIIANSLIAGSLYTLVALGFFMIYRTVKFFDVSYGALTAFGGFMMYWLFKQVEMQSIPAFVVALVLTGFISFLLSKFVYQPLRKRKSSNMVLLVASLGLFTSLQAILAILFSSQFQTIHISELQGSINIAGAFITYTQLLTIGLAFFIFIILSVLLSKTRFGAAIRAIGDDEDVAVIVGIDTKKIITWVFIIAGIIAGLAGILVGIDTGIEPTMGMQLLLKAVIVVTIAGIGRIHGVVIGAFLLAFVENFAVWHLSGEWKNVVALSILIIFLLFKPEGITGSK